MKVFTQLAAIAFLTLLLYGWSELEPGFGHTFCMVCSYLLILAVVVEIIGDKIKELITLYWYLKRGKKE